MRCFKKSAVTTLFILIVFSLTSCKKEVTNMQSYDPTTGVVSLIKNDNFMPGNYVYFLVSQNADAIDTSASFTISVFGKFTNEATGATLNAGDIMINNSQTVSSGPDNLYQYTFDQNTLPLGKAYLGNFLDVRIKGSSSVDSLRRQLYIPKPIFLYNRYKGTATISNDKSYNLSWNPDPQNMFGKVLIQVENHGGLSNYNNAGNPKSVDGLTYTVNDNGSFVIPRADLHRFPVSSYISISISRATDNSWPTGNSRTEYIAVTCAYSAPILVQN